MITLEQRLIDVEAKIDRILFALNATYDFTENEENYRKLTNSDKLRSGDERWGGGRVGWEKIDQENADMYNAYRDKSPTRFDSFRRDV